jgi:uncharacterized protein (DUF3084 family)
MMSLAPYLPPTSGEAGATYALLQVIADPKAAKAALDKMMEERKAIEAATEKQREMMATAAAAAKTERAANEKAKAEAERLATQAQTDLGHAKAKLQEAERRKAEMESSERRAAEAHVLLDEREQRLKAVEGEHLDTTRMLQMRERDIEKKEQALKQREANLEMREETLADDIREHNEWLAGLKPPRAR